MAHLLQLANCNRPNLSQKGYKSSMLQLPRLPLFYKRTPEGYFEAKTGVFNKTHYFLRQIHTCDLQYQSFTNIFISLSLNIRIYCSNVISCLVLRLESLQSEIELHQYTTELIILQSYSSKLLLSA